MKRQILDILIQQSYTKNELDKAVVEKIAAQLSRKDLKVYIDALKRKEQQHTVVVTIPMPVDKNTEQSIQNLFSEKKIVYNNDQTLLAGIKVQDNDTIYDMSIKNRLDTLYSYLTK